MILTHGAARYRVGALVAEAVTYRVYICEDVATGRQCLLQIASEIEHNGGLDRAAFILKELKRTSDSYEEEYAKLGTGRLLSYDRLFPQAVSSFVSDEQGKRRINILALTDVDIITEMVPLSNLVTKDRLRVDLKTSAWILGRLLKLLAFAHGQGIAVRMLAGSNVLINPGRHFVIVLDWSSAFMYSQEVPVDVRKDDIGTAAQTVFTAIGGDSFNGSYKYLTEDNRRHVEFLADLMRRPGSNAEQAHGQFYELVEELYGRTFHPFATLPL